MAFEENPSSNGKNDVAVAMQKSSDELVPSSHLVEAFEHVRGDTSNDVSDMKRLGKKPEFRVHQSLSSVAV